MTHFYQSFERFLSQKVNTGRMNSQIVRSLKRRRSLLTEQGLTNIKSANWFEIVTDYSKKTLDQEIDLATSTKYVSFVHSSYLDKE